MNLDAAFKLRKPEELRAACAEAETRNVEAPVIRALYSLYYAAVEREQRMSEVALALQEVAAGKDGEAK